ncbi:MAG: GntR family transcriptional regulator [Conexibacter sp.]|nr:GntR family transcriptional regulator [Conexibacter sp.]
MTDDAPPFDLTHARAAFATAAHLHGEATRRSAAALTAADFERLREIDAAYVAALRDGRVQDAIDADDAFHRVLVDAAGDPDLRISVELLVPRLHRMDLWFFTRKAFAAGTNSHPAIILALEAGDVETAATLVERSHTEAGEELSAVLARSGS